MRRQLDDCRAEAERRAWSMAEEYVDDDVSAYSGRQRPAYESMLADLTEGRRDGVIVWHIDRLHRRPIELERFVDVCTRSGVRDLVTLSGDIDLVKRDGRLMARLLAAVAANESDSKRRRGGRKALEIAQFGRPTMCGPRPFGFEDDHVAHHPVEAPVIRDLATRASAGETLISLATWLQDADVRTVAARRGGQTRCARCSPTRGIGACASIRARSSERQCGEPVISAEQGERLRRLRLDPARRTNRSERRYLLTGMLRCGKCGNRLHSAPKDGVRRYGCRMGPDARGYGGVFIYAEMLEAFITEAVLWRLDSPDLHQATQAVPGDEAARDLAERIDSATARLDDLATMWADGAISKEEWLTARERIEQRLQADRGAFARLTRRDAVQDYLGRGDELRAQWAGLNLSRQVAIVKAVLAKVTILPAAVPGRRGLDPQRVVPQWRL